MMTVYVCDYCGETHRSPISAALCCDVVSNELDRDLDGETIERGID